jgi:LuxR family maltose regulon positive regulatory protein
MSIDTIQPENLLTTKLYRPPTRPNLLSRPRLVERLDASVHPGRKLTLVSAPAGFGKTTLISEWVAAWEQPVAWLSLDREDNNPTRFLSYLIGALQTLDPDIGEGAVAALQSPQPPRIEAILTVLLNELSTLSESFVLVIDDYHVIEAQAAGASASAAESISVDAALTFLLDHLPPQMHLIIATRVDPSLPLPRYRAQGQLTEVRVADLRFTEVEAAEFLEQVMNLDLSEEDIAALETRTEGWIAGLQLAALALQGLDQQKPSSLPENQTTSRFIESFTGSHHFILDYLVEEVLKQQRESVQTFLLQTSILDRLCGSLCDAVWKWHADTEPSLPANAEPSPLNSQSILEYLERSNLFLVPLDYERLYYRYHHLFADVLRHRLQRSSPDLVPRLHARAATWFEEQGNASDAFQHWRAAEDYPQAAEVIETYGYRYFEKADFQQLSHWLEQIPPALIQTKPWLCIFHSWGLIFTGQYEEADRYLTEAEKTLGPVSRLHDPERRDLYGHIAASRAFLASRSQDGEGIVHYADLTMHYVSDDRQAIRGYMAFLRGTGRYQENQYTLAQASWREAARQNEDAGNTMVAVNSLVALAELYRVQGKLHKSLNTYQEAAELALDARGKPLPVSAEVYVARARLHYEWNDIDVAEADLVQAADLMKLYPGFDLKVDYHTVLSRLHLAQGNPAQAANLIHEIETSDRQPFYRSAAAFLACRINYYLAVGDLTMVEEILDQQDWTLEDKNIFAWAEAFLAYARVLLYQDEFQRSYDLLDACREKLETYKLWTPALKALIFQACISQQRGEADMARQQIKRALMLAEPEGYVRIFVDAGPLVAQLLSEAGIRGMMPDYTRKLLTAFEDEYEEGQEISHPTSIPSDQPLIEPLSPRELEVLQLIAQGLSNREIAERLFLALSTVKGHNRVIYEKLQVHRRTEAVARARELDLL